MTHLLMTNDYPPKIGGLQTYFYELWRRIPQDSFQVFTSPYQHDQTFDASQTHAVIRYKRFWLAPTPQVIKQANAAASEIDASLTVIQPGWPLGFIGPNLKTPYAVTLHGAEVSVPARLPFAKAMLKRAIGNASLLISASRFAEEVAVEILGDGEVPPIVYVPPGVDTKRFVPLSDSEKLAARKKFGFSDDAQVVVGISRLVRRKGFDVLIKASAQLKDRLPNLEVAIAGTGKDSRRLASLISKTKAPVRMLGFVKDEDLPDLYGCADVFTMLCRNQWAGLEQEGFGIVFVEAAAAGCPQIAGLSGGSADAVIDGETGVVVKNPKDVKAVTAAIEGLLTNPQLRAQMAKKSREHAVNSFCYDLLAERLQRSLVSFEQRD